MANGHWASVYEGDGLRLIETGLQQNQLEGLAGERNAGCRVTMLSTSAPSVAHKPSQWTHEPHPNTPIKRSLASDPCDA